MMHEPHAHNTDQSKWIEWFQWRHDNNNIHNMNGEHDENISIRAANANSELRRCRMSISSLGVAARACTRPTPTIFYSNNIIIILHRYIIHCIHGLACDSCLHTVGTTPLPTLSLMLLIFSISLSHCSPCVHHNSDPSDKNIGAFRTVHARGVRWIYRASVCCEPVAYAYLV